MNSSNFFSAFIMPAILLTATVVAKTKPAENIVTIREVRWIADSPGTIDMDVYIGNFLLVRAKGLRPPRARINRTFRVRSRFRLPLSFRVRLARERPLPLPGYVADWDNGHPSRSYCKTTMPWGFSGTLQCGNLKIRVVSRKAGQ